MKVENSDRQCVYHVKDPIFGGGKVILINVYCICEDCLTTGILNVLTLSILISLQIMMFQTRMMSGRMNVYDRYRDWRLDVDRMSYEVLDFFFFPTNF